MGDASYFSLSGAATTTNHNTYSLRRTSDIGAAEQYIAGHTLTEVWRPDLSSEQGAQNIREVVRRELEKERIRAEIIAEETARRRLLEEEVRRELALEREMAMIRRREAVPTFPFGPSTMRWDSRIIVPPSMTNFETNSSPLIEDKFMFPADRELTRVFEPLPFQRHPYARNVEPSSAATLHDVKSPPPLPDVAKDNVFALAKPEASLSGLKRKASASSPSGTGVAEAPSSVTKRKSNEEWSCALCQVSATSEQGLNEHLRGKKHRAREARLVAPNTGLGTRQLPKKIVNTISNPSKVPTMPSTQIFGEDASKATDTFGKKGSDACKTSETPTKKGENAIISDKTGQSTRRSSPKSAKQKKNLSYWCEICKVGAHSVKVLNAHKSGKKHLLKLQKVSKLSKTVPHAVSIPVVTEGMTDSTVGDEQAEDKEMESAPVVAEGLRDATVEDQQVEEEMKSAPVVAEGLRDATVEDQQVEEEMKSALVVNEGKTGTTVEDTEVEKKDTENVVRNESSDALEMVQSSDTLEMVQSADNGVIAAEQGSS